MRCVQSAILALSITTLCRADLPDVPPPPGTESTTPTSPAIEPTKAQLSAATENGLKALAEQVRRTPLTAESTIGQFVEKSRSQSAFDQMLLTAQPVGGPRWVDDHTCQIRVELSGDDLAKFLSTAGADTPSVARLRRQKFVATGVSANGDVIGQAHPRAGGGRWTAVAEFKRQATLVAARTEAIDKSIAQIGAVPVGEKFKLSDYLKTSTAHDRLTALLKRSVTRIDFKDDLTVDVSVSVPVRSLTAELKAVARKPANAPAVDWTAIDRDLSALPTPVVGSASAATGTTLPVFVLPIQVPDGVETDLEADGTSTSVGSPLRTGRAAEAAAVAKIRQKLLAVKVTTDKTLADLATADPTLARSIDKALLKCRVSGPDRYFPDKSATVHVSLDLHDVWDDLRSGS